MVYTIGQDTLIEGTLQTTGSIYNNSNYHLLDNNGSTWINGMLIANGSPYTDFHFVPGYTTQSGGESRVFFGYGSNWGSYNWMNGTNFLMSLTSAGDLSLAGGITTNGTMKAQQNFIELTVYDTGSGKVNIWDFLHLDDYNDPSVGAKIKINDYPCGDVHFASFYGATYTEPVVAPAIVCSHHLLVRKDFLTRGQLESYEGIITLHGGHTGWSPDPHNPTIRLARADAYGNYSTLEIRKYVDAWGWGDLACGTIKSGAGGTNQAGYCSYFGGGEGGASGGIKIDCWGNLCFNGGSAGRNWSVFKNSDSTTPILSLYWSDLKAVFGGGIETAGQITVTNSNGIFPAANGQGSVGAPGTVGFPPYWGAVYANILRYHTDHIAFDTIDDLALVKGYTIKQVTIQQPSGEETTENVIDGDSINFLRDQQGFYDPAKTSGFLLGCTKALALKHDEHEANIAELHNTLETIETQIQDLQQQITQLKGGASA